VTGSMTEPRNELNPRWMSGTSRIPSQSILLGTVMTMMGSS